MLAFTVWIAGALVSAQDPEWTVLFDGKSLNGWKANDNASSFQLVKGEIVAHGECSHLFYVGDGKNAEFENFELEVEILTRPGANSGVYFHTRYQQSGWLEQGHEAQVNTSQSDEIKSGSLYSVVKVNPAPTVDDQWFTMNVRVVGQRITIRVDGKTTVDYLEPKNMQGGRRLSKGTFALQAHDPGSEVHYRAVRVRRLPSGSPALTRADRVSTRRHLSDWWDRMDYGPFITSTVDLDADHSVHKGITVELNADRQGSVVFDTDLLCVAAGWPGPLKLMGTPYDGRHGEPPSLKNEKLWFVSPIASGVAPDGNLLDQRAIPHGPMPKHRGRYLGLYRDGDHVVFSYRVGTTKVLEMPGFETAENVHAITRSISIEKSEHPLTVLLCDARQSEVKIGEDETWAVLKPTVSPLPPADVDRVVVVADRTEGEWSDLAMGPPVNGDWLDKQRNAEVQVRYVEGFTAPHSKSGSVDGTLPRLHDGDAPTRSDQPSKVSFFDDGTGRVHVDLGACMPLVRINSFSWHRSDRSPQKFTVWGSASDQADPKAQDPESGQWKLIAAVDSTDLGEGGKHGSSILNRKGKIGDYRHLMFDIPANEQNQGIFLAEIDVFVEGDPVADLKEPAPRGERRPLSIAVVSSKTEVQVAHQGDHLVAVVPAAATPCSFKAVLTREIGEPSLESFAPFAPPADVAAHTRGGPTLWPDVLRVKGVEDGATNVPYVVDDIPIPFENPWDCSMRIGGFDFFADGTRAAVCTWNGDVWIVTGLGGKLGEITWKRFAAGLFEPLGLCIVEDVIYVNGRDQITRLHDLNADGEADFYENFNNDVFTTRNFHEFTFDLQTDAQGNFYFSKGGPVKPGGRGFEKIVPHHGTVMKVSADGSTLEVMSTGMRAPNGIGVGPGGQLTAGDNEGTWVPHCKLHWLKPGSFQGVIDTAHRSDRPTSYNPPLCWFPMHVDNSGGSQVWVTSDRFGPFQGELLHFSYGQSSIYKVMKQDLGDVVQGGVFRLPITLGSSAMRGRFNRKDGQLYVSGLKGWQTNAARLSAFQRVRYTGAPVCMPCNMTAVHGGIEIEFTCALDKKLAEDVQSYAMEQWNYVWGPMYGSPEVSVRNPDPEFLKTAQGSEQHQYKQHDTVKITTAKLVSDRKVFLGVPDLLPAMQTSLKLDLESARGEEMIFEIFSTIHRLPELRTTAAGSGG